MLRTKKDGHRCSTQLFLRPKRLRRCSKSTLRFEVGKSCSALVTGREGSDGALQKNLETFLRKVTIMSEHVCDASFSHRYHRDAVRQAIPFIGSSLIQIKTSQQ